MSSNPNKEMLKARRYIMEHIATMPDEGLNLLDFELEILASFSVSNSFPRTFIKNYFLDAGTYFIEGSFLKKRKGDEL
jgi:hypothetical protein